MNIYEKHVLEIIGEDTTSPDVFVNTDAGLAPIRDSINDAIEEISMLTGGYKETYRVPLRQGQQFYRMKFAEGHFGWVTNAFIVNRKYRLKATSIIELGQYDPRFMVPTGEPWKYFQVGLDVIGFYPRPSADSDIIEIEAASIPSRYTSDADRIKLRDAFKWAPVHYAAGEYFASRGDAREADIHHAKYLDILGMSELQPAFNEEIQTAATK